MKKILIFLLVFSIFTYNTNITQANTTSKTIVEVKIDKILSKFFTKIDKKWKNKANIIYKKIISKIDSISKDTKNTKKLELLKYLKVQFVNKLEIEKIEVIEDKDNLEINKSNDSVNFVENTKKNWIKINQKANTSSVWMSTWYDSFSQSEIEDYDRAKFNALPKLEREWSVVKVKPYAGIESWASEWAITERYDYVAWIITWRIPNSFSQETKDRLNWEWKMASAIYFNWAAVNETDPNWLTSLNWHSLNELFSYYLSWDASYREGEKVFLENSWYRVENWKLVYHDNLNKIKIKYSDFITIK